MACLLTQCAPSFLPVMPLSGPITCNQNSPELQREYADHTAEGTISSKIVHNWIRRVRYDVLEEVRKCSRQRKTPGQKAQTWKNIRYSGQGGQLGQSTGDKTDASLPQMLKQLTDSHMLLVSTQPSSPSVWSCLITLPDVPSGTVLYFCFTGFIALTVCEILLLVCQCVYGLSLPGYRSYMRTIPLSVLLPLTFVFTTKFTETSVDIRGE